MINSTEEFPLCPVTRQSSLKLSVGYIHGVRKVMDYLDTYFFADIFQREGPKVVSVQTHLHTFLLKP